MEEHQIDLQDWEILTDPSSPSPSPSPNPNPNPNPNPFDDTDAIDPNYFSPEPTPKPIPFEDSASVESDNPSWIDPDTHSPKTQFTSSFWSEEGSAVGDVSEEIGFEEKEGEEEEREVKVGGGEGEKGFWWKDRVLEMLKVWVLRAPAISTVWTVSMAAAAIVGVVILGRRLMYRMRRRSKAVPLKIAMDDKKASQFMARVTRLNEAFSVVKRIPIVRPSLPPSGITSWPMASLR